MENFNKVAKEREIELKDFVVIDFETAKRYRASLRGYYCA